MDDGEQIEKRRGNASWFIYLDKAFKYIGSDTQDFFIFKHIYCLQPCFILSLYHIL